MSTRRPGRGVRASAGVLFALAAGMVAADAISAAMAPAERAALEADLLSAWSEQRQFEDVIAVQRWHREAALLLARADDAQLLRAAGMPNLEDAIAALHGSDGHGNARPATSAGGEDIHGKALGDIHRDLVFTPIQPCRILDTRNTAAGAIAANSTRSFAVAEVASYASQGGSGTNCGGLGAAGSFAAVAVQLVAISPATAGYLIAYPFNAPRPLAGTLNYSAGVVAGNATVVQLDQGASDHEMSIYSFAQTHVVADVYGYYSTAVAPTPALSCVTVQANGTVPAGGSVAVTAPACAAGAVSASTGCASGSGVTFSTIAGGTCAASNPGGASAAVQARRVCCSVQAN